MITASNITMQFGEKPLFENVCVKFGNHNRYGLIGANGCGKSTFMKILSGDLAQTDGNVSLDPDITFSVLKQDQFMYEEYNVIDVVIMGDKKLWEIKQRRDYLYALEEMSESEGVEVGELEASFGELDGYTAEARAGDLLLGLKIEEDLHYGPMSAVAPGWKFRVLLAQVLFSNPDLLLLDEPTNNLDIDTINWLEKLLVNRKSTMVIISHDRHFLNSICTHMADIDYGEIRLFTGNYDDYMVASTQAMETMKANNAKKQAKISELQSFVSRFSANASKAKQATSRAKQLEKIELDEIKPSSRVNPYIVFKEKKKLFNTAFTVENISKKYDKKIFKDFSITVPVGEKIAIIGQNGIGKTTLLRSMCKNLETDSGSVKLAENAEVGYFAQEHAEDFPEETSLFNWMSQWGGNAIDDQGVRNILGRLLFSKYDSEKSVNVISGGEKGRMVFGKLMIEEPNVLFMDEPTNHLDMESIESLNLALTNYEGTLVFVSHDREFVSSIATMIIEMTPKGIVHFHGNYEDFLAKKKREAKKK